MGFQLGNETFNGYGAMNYLSAAKVFKRFLKINGTVLYAVFQAELVSDPA